MMQFATAISHDQFFSYSCVFDQSKMELVDEKRYWKALDATLTRREQRRNRPAKVASQLETIAAKLESDRLAEDTEAHAQSVDAVRLTRAHSDGLLVDGFDPAEMSDEELAAFLEAADDVQVVLETRWRFHVSGHWYDFPVTGQHVATTSIPAVEQVPRWIVTGRLPDLWRIVPAVNARPIVQPSKVSGLTYLATEGRLERDKSTAISMALESIARFLKTLAAEVHFLETCGS